MQSAVWFVERMVFIYSVRLFYFCVCVLFLSEKLSEQANEQVFFIILSISDHFTIL